MKRDIIVRNQCNQKSVKAIIKELFSLVPKSFVLQVQADEGNPEDTPGNEGNPEDNKDPSPGPTINYEDLLVKIRKEEKNKHQSIIKNLKAQVETLTKQHNDDLLKISGLEDRLSIAEEKLTTASTGDSEEVKTLKKELKDLKKEKGDLDKELAEIKKTLVTREEVEEEIRTELESEYKVKTYKAEKLAEHKSDILVPELVMGSTTEEIDESIKQALARSEDIRKDLGITGQPSPQQNNARTPNTTGNPGIGRVQDSSFSEEYIAGLDVGSPEYAEFRKQIGLR